MDSLALFTLAVTFSIVYLALGFVQFYFYLSRKEELIQHITKAEAVKGEKRSWWKALWEKVFAISDSIGPFVAKVYSTPEKDEKWLNWAGRPMGLTLTRYYGLRVLWMVLGIILGYLYYYIGLPFDLYLFLLSPVVSFFGVSMWLRSRANKRQEEISVNLPNFLDTVSIALAAGGSLVQSLEEVSRQMGGALSEEILRMTHELQLGVARRQAYENLLARNRSKPLETFIQALIQGSDLGVPISTTFRIQADEIRSSRIHRAKEKAAKASPRITLVTTLMITPTIFFLVIGMLILNFIYNPDAFGLRLLF